MIRLLLVPVMALVLSACANHNIPITRQDLAPQNEREAIAKLVLNRPIFGSMSAIKAKIIDAEISVPEQKRDNFGNVDHTYYCVKAYIENTLFPLHQPVYASVKMYRKTDGISFNVTTSNYRPCIAARFEAFPEIEKLSVSRYKPE